MIKHILGDCFKTPIRDKMCHSKLTPYTMYVNLSHRGNNHCIYSITVIKFKTIPTNGTLLSLMVSKFNMCNGGIGWDCNCTNVMATSIL